MASLATIRLLNGVNLEANQDEKYLAFLQLAEGTLTEEQLADWIRKRI